MERLKAFADAFLLTRKATDKPKLSGTIKRALKRAKRIKAILAHK